MILCTRLICWTGLSKQKNPMCNRYIKKLIWKLRTLLSLYMFFFYWNICYRVGADIRLLDYPGRVQPISTGFHSCGPGTVQCSSPHNFCFMSSLTLFFSISIQKCWRPDSKPLRFGYLDLVVSLVRYKNIIYTCFLIYPILNLVYFFWRAKLLY